MKFFDFEYASATSSFLVNGEIYNTSAVNMDHIRDKINETFMIEAKEQAGYRKKVLEEIMNSEVKDGDFRTFAEFDGKMYMLIVNRTDGVVSVIKANKKRPPKFKGHECNIADKTSLFA